MNQFYQVAEHKRRRELKERELSAKRKQEDQEKKRNEQERKQRQEKIKEENSMRRGVRVKASTTERVNHFDISINFGFPACQGGRIAEEER